MTIIDNFPKVRGVLQENASLKNRSFFGVGGNAEVLFIPEDMDDLILFLRNIQEDTQITVLGAISNVLIRSGGIDGVVIILGKWFERIFIENGIIEVGSFVRCGKLSTIAMDAELGGLEFLSGIPGTVGGAIKMNAGCYGSEIKDIMIECEAVTYDGNIKWLKNKDINFEYRTSNMPEDYIITRAWFKGVQSPCYSIPKKTNEILKKRRDTQPIDKKTCGSTFKNPPNHPAWALIKEAGCIGLKVGGAVISDKHCNFIVNTGDADADDIERLGETVVRKVCETSGITLEWEIIRLGKSSSIKEG